jgi:hypothetical protein
MQMIILERNFFLILYLDVVAECLDIYPWYAMRYAICAIHMFLNIGKEFLFLNIGKEFFFY